MQARQARTWARGPHIHRRFFVLGAVLATVMVAGAIAIPLSRTGGDRATRSTLPGVAEQPSSPSALQPVESLGVAFQPAAVSAIEPTHLLEPSFEYRATDFLALVDGRRSPEILTILDSASGARTAQLAVGFDSLVVHRPSAGQILVSDGDRLSTIDAAELEPIRSIELPNRVANTAYFPAIVLSADEQYLAYVTHTSRDDVASCANGGHNLVCDQIGVGVLNLGATPIVGDHYVMPQGCGYPIVSASGAGFAVACTDGGTVSTIAPAAGTMSTVSFLSELDMDPDPVLSHNPNRLLFATTVDGRSAALRRDGVLLFSMADGSVERARAIPEGTRVAAQGQVFEIAPGRLLIGYIERYFDSELSGYAIFDTASRGIVADVDLGGVGATLIVPMDDSTVAAITARGVEVLDRSGASTRVLPVEVSDASYLVR